MANTLGLHLHGRQVLAVGIRIPAAHEDGPNPGHIRGHVGECILERTLVLDEIHVIVEDAALDKIIDFRERVAGFDIQHGNVTAGDVLLAEETHEEIEQDGAVLAAVEAED